MADRSPSQGQAVQGSEIGLQDPEPRIHIGQVEESVMELGCPVHRGELCPCGLGVEEASDLSPLLVEGSKKPAAHVEGSDAVAVPG